METQLTPAQEDRWAKFEGRVMAKHESTKALHDKKIREKDAEAVRTDDLTKHRLFQDNRTSTEFSSKEGLAQRAERLKNTKERDAKARANGKSCTSGMMRNSQSKKVTSYPKWLEKKFVQATKLLIELSGTETIQNNVLITLLADNVLVREYRQLPAKYSLHVSDDGRINQYIGMAFYKIVTDAKLLWCPNRNAKKWKVVDYEDKKDSNGDKKQTVAQRCGNRTSQRQHRIAHHGDNVPEAEASSDE